MREHRRASPNFDDLYARIAALPEGRTGEILVDGEILVRSRPRRPHRTVAKRLLRALDGWDVDQGGRGFWIEVEAEVKLLGARLLVPDLSGWRVERVPELPEQEPIEISPDWVCEVLSHTTARVDRLDKLPLYSQAGVRWVWLVDPLARSVEVFETRDGRATLATTARDDFAGVLQPFDDEIALTTVWPVA